jgi:hypothetical protein
MKSVSAETTHPQWVHEQCGTASESELQRSLDATNVSDWYRDGKKKEGSSEPTR